AGRRAARPRSGVPGAPGGAGPPPHRAREGALGPPTRLADSGKRGRRPRTDRSSLHARGIRRARVRARRHGAVRRRCASATRRAPRRRRRNGSREAGGSVDGQSRDKEPGTHHRDARTGPMEGEMNLSHNESFVPKRRPETSINAAEAERRIQDGDILLWRGNYSVSKAFELLTGSWYTHAAFVVHWEG